MTPERWRRVKEVLGLALTRPPDERAAALDAMCGDHPSVRREVADLLECEGKVGGFLEPPGSCEEPEPTPDDLLPPALQDWTHYEVIERIGSGGMATVYKAWDPRLRRAIAVKVIGAHDALTVQRFLREAEAQARVEHDNVLKVYETGVIGQHHYIAMQYVDGPTLLGVRDETTLDRKVELMLEIAEGLHAAHRHGLVHRDIKPGNILVERGPDRLKPYLLDFGLAAEVGAPGLTSTGMLVGTPRYMAPERIQGGAATLDRRSDIYSLGATFYEFLCGAAPFDSSSGLQVLVDVLERDFTPLRRVQPSLPAELDAIVGKCLEKDPGQRYQSARALADDLRRYLDGDHVLARPVGRVRRFARKARKHPRLAATFAALVLTIVSVAAWGGYTSWRGARQAALAQQVGEEIQDLEWLFRAAQMSPLHPIDPHRRQVRQRMANLEAMMSEVGSLAFGPGHYALGRGFLTLGNYTSALDHLDRAWNSGYHTADAAAALGLTHGEIFRIELVKAQRIGGDREREARIRAIETAHRDRALSFLNQGRSSAIFPSRYVDALIAAYSNDLPAAIAKADAAAQETPWLFEARLLPGHLAFQEARRLRFRGQLQDAGRQLTNALKSYAEAQRVAPSSLDAYVGECAVSGFLLHLILHEFDGDPAAAYRQADEACSRALVVDPASVDVYRVYAEAVTAKGAVDVLQERDPGDAFDRATALASKAIALSGGDIGNLLVLADILINHAWWEERSSRDPREKIERAVATFQQVLAVDPRNLTAAGDMGQVLIMRARYESRHGLDPSDAAARALASLKLTLRIDPLLASGFKNLASLGLGRATQQMRQGIDPGPWLEEILRFIDSVPAEGAPASRAEAVAALRAKLAEAHAVPASTRR